MTLDQLETAILALPVPTTPAEWPAYRQACRDHEAEYSAGLTREIDLADALADLDRPQGQPFDSPEWNLYLDRAARIEAAFA